MELRLHRAGMALIGAIALAGVDAPASWAKAGGAEPAAAAATTARAARSKRVIAGFRMEGDPAIETVFGDTERYKSIVDRFYELHESMRATRADFSRFVRAAQTTLEAHRSRCPTDALAPLYASAFDHGRRYRELGAELESHYTSIRELDELGETSGLTPDYRWRVNRVRQLYRAALVDYREMRAVFDEQLTRDLDHRRCDRDQLLALGAEAASAAESLASAALPTRPAPETGPVTVAATTFIIDNTTCGTALHVYVDGLLLGDVASYAKAAFQTQPGRHSLCLIATGSRARCGDTGTVRSASIHDGWAMTMRCE